MSDLGKLWRLLCCCVVLCVGGCGPTPEDLVEQLVYPDKREAASQELLLAKAPIAPLLVVWADPQCSEAYPHLVDVLLSLLSRVDDERLPASLGNYLKNGPHAEVRARIPPSVCREGMRSPVPS